MVNIKTHENKAVPVDLNELNNNRYVLKAGQLPEYEDKTSDNYIPKSYRSQSKLGLQLTYFLDKYLGVRFLQPIKWQNTISIFLIHIIFIIMAICFPWNYVMWKTAVLSEYFLQI